MFLYAAALMLEFAALVWVRIKEPHLPCPHRIPFGLTGVIAISIPPTALCLVSIALSSRATRYASFGAIAIGLAVYRWQAKGREAAEFETAPTL
ncbi:MAG: hypothetical protein ACM3SP_22095 [Chloroflexota bacterium]